MTSEERQVTQEWGDTLYQVKKMRRICSMSLKIEQEG
nr:MAG TPA: nonstructural protein [Caudoviricetes sp.]